MAYVYKIVCVSIFVYMDVFSNVGKILTELYVNIYVGPRMFALQVCVCT